MTTRPDHAPPGITPLEGVKLYWRRLLPLARKEGVPTRAALLFTLSWLVWRAGIAVEDVAWWLHDRAAEITRREYETELNEAIRARNERTGVVT